MFSSKNLKKLMFVLLAIYCLSFIVYLIYLTRHVTPPIIAMSFFIVSNIVGIIFLILIFRYFFPVYEKTHRIARLNNVFYQLLQKSVYIQESEEFYTTILESAIESIDPGHKGSIMLMNSEMKKLHFVACIGYDFDILKNTFLDLEQTYLYRESNGNINKSVRIHDPFEYDRKKLDSENVDTILEAGSENVMTTLSTPIYYEGKLYGMINIDSPHINAYDSYDIETLEMFAIEISNVLKLYKSMEQTHYYTNYDLLTDLPNRKHINELIETAHQDAIKENKNYSLVSLDLNNLKKTNDRYGHEYGDELLKEFSKIFFDNLPKGTTIGRYGGDEFILVMPNYSKKEARQVLVSIEVIFSKQPLKYKSLTMQITFCYGISSYDSDATDMEELIRLSDQEMYESKNAYHSINNASV